MFFNSINFFVFFAIVLIIYYQLKHKGQNRWLLLSSYVFYGVWDWRFLSLILFSTTVDFFIGQKIYASNNSNTNKKLILISLIVNLGLLCAFKYFNFFLDSFESLFAIFGLNLDFITLSIILPVGISFYTFQTLAYTIDVYRKKLSPINDFFDFALYVSFFPQLVAGPIERAQNLLPQIQKNRSATINQIKEGLVLIGIGLFRKVVIADNLAEYVDRTFTSPEIYSSTGLVIGVYAFALQIYGDFAGYTDIARGVSKLLGFELIVNFNQPYFSTNITEFWRRWHISLSSWLKDYLYISLGGNRQGTLNTYKNLMITMLLGGLWHGASWVFVIWGALHGFFLIVHKYFYGGIVNKFNSNNYFISIFKTFLLFNLVCIAWIFFRSYDLNNALAYCQGIFNFSGSMLDISNPGKILEPGLALSLSTLALLYIDIPQYKSDNHTIFLQWHWARQGIFYFLILFSIVLFFSSNDTPFIYFQF